MSFTRESHAGFGPSRNDAAVSEMFRVATWLQRKATGALASYTRKFGFITDDVLCFAEAPITASNNGQRLPSVQARWSLSHAAVDLAELPPLAIRISGLLPVSSIDSNHQRSGADGGGPASPSPSSAAMAATQGVTLTILLENETDFTAWIVALREAMVVCPRSIRRVKHDLPFLSELRQVVVWIGRPHPPGGGSSNAMATIEHLCSSIQLSIRSAQLPVPTCRASHPAWASVSTSGGGVATRPVLLSVFHSPSEVSTRLFGTGPFSEYELEISRSTTIATSMSSSSSSSPFDVVFVKRRRASLGPNQHTQRVLLAPTAAPEGSTTGATTTEISHPTVMWRLRGIHEGVEPGATIGGLDPQLFSCVCVGDMTAAKDPTQDRADEREPAIGGLLIRSTPPSPATAVASVSLATTGPAAGSSGTVAAPSPFAIHATTDAEWRADAMRLLQQGLLVVLTDAPNAQPEWTDDGASASPLQQQQQTTKSRGSSTVTPSATSQLSRTLSIVLVGCSGVGKSRLVQLLLQSSIAFTRDETETMAGGTSSPNGAHGSGSGELRGAAHEEPPFGRAGAKGLWQNAGSTVGVNHVEVVWPVGVLPWPVSITDTSGNSSKDLLRSLCRAADVVVALFDCTDAFSLSWLDKMIPQLSNVVPPEKVHLVGVNAKHPRRIIDSARLSLCHYAARRSLIDDGLDSASVNGVLDTISQDSAMYRKLQAKSAAKLRDDLLELVFPTLVKRVSSRIATFYGLHASTPVVLAAKALQCKQQPTAATGDRNASEQQTNQHDDDDATAESIRMSESQFQQLLSILGLCVATQCGMFNSVVLFASRVRDEVAAPRPTGVSSARSAINLSALKAGATFGDDPTSMPASPLRQIASSRGMKHVGIAPVGGLSPQRNRMDSSVFQRFQSGSCFALASDDEDDDDDDDDDGDGDRDDRDGDNERDDARRTKQKKKKKRDGSPGETFVALPDVILWLGVSLSIELDARAIAFAEALEYVCPSPSLPLPTTTASSKSLSALRHGSLHSEFVRDKVGTGPAHVVQPKRLQVLFEIARVDVAVALVADLLRCMDVSQRGYVDGTDFMAFAANPSAAVTEWSSGMRATTLSSTAMNCRIALGWCAAITGIRLGSVSETVCHALVANAMRPIDAADLGMFEATSEDAAATVGSSTLNATTHAKAGGGGAATTAANMAGTSGTAQSHSLMDSKSCFRCGADFNLTRKRYECYNCQHGFCWSCCDMEASFAAHGADGQLAVTTQRVCVDCHTQLTEVAAGPATQPAKLTTSALTAQQHRLQSIAATKAGSPAGSATNNNTNSRRQNIVRWQRDEAVNECTLCSLPFGLARLRLRHHCRMCGKVVCASCSPRKAVVEGYKKPERVCLACERVRQPSVMKASSTGGDAAPSPMGEKPTNAAAPGEKPTLAAAAIGAITHTTHHDDNDANALDRAAATEDRRDAVPNLSFITALSGDAALPDDDDDGESKRGSADDAPSAAVLRAAIISTYVRLNAVKEFANAVLSIRGTEAPRAAGSLGFQPPPADVLTALASDDMDDDMFFQLLSEIDARDVARMSTMGSRAEIVAPWMSVPVPTVVDLPWYDTYSDEDDLRIALAFLKSADAKRYADDPLVEYCVRQPGYLECDEELEAAVDGALEAEMGPE